MFEVWWKITEEMTDMKKLLTIFLLSFSINGYCEWFKVVESDNSTVYVEDSKISKSDKFIRIWTLHNLSNPRKLNSGKSYRSYITLTEVDCLEDKSRDLSTTVYQNIMGNGDVVITFEENSKLKFSPPGSVGDLLIKFSCGFK